ncbi:insulin-like growth factor-binding protein 5b [Hemiscyllium ocellatum]|uniref:insulin-like growth factor-binding protein 5b n=1 Tax=Hemiscyllium ocellatum TaxID=170820 RepID=UPI002966BB8D|nr:insulin-like growth factor-binding protein 5b [Hemiscyllium ocellatum]
MLLWTISLLLLAGCSCCQALGPMVNCEPCDEKAESLCQAQPVGCQLVKEPGCGCCMTCALTEGQSCGVYTEICGTDLKCLPKPEEEKPLHALLHGRGICLPARSYRHSQEEAAAAAAAPQPRPVKDPPETEESISLDTAEEGYSSNPMPKKHSRLPNHKVEALNKDRKKRLHISKIISSSENTSHDRRLPGHKQESELGPCRRQMQVVLQNLKKAAYLSPHEVYIPNCDRKGLYKRKQCKPSKGKRRGLCWCVNKHGLKLPGSDFKHRDFQCHSFESN